MIRIDEHRFTIPFIENSRQVEETKCRLPLFDFSQATARFRVVFPIILDLCGMPFPQRFTFPGGHLFFRDGKGRPALTKERAPAIVVWGAHDPYIDGVFADRFGAREVHRFPDSGHWVIAEEAEAVAQKLGELAGSLVSSSHYSPYVTVGITTKPQHILKVPGPVRIVTA